MTLEEPLERLAESAMLATPTARKRMLIVVNPYASSVSPHLRNLVVSALAGRYEVEAVDTQSRNHATDLVREAAHEGYDVVVSFGGSVVRVNPSKSSSLNAVTICRIRSARSGHPTRTTGRARGRAPLRLMSAGHVHSHDVVTLADPEAVRPRTGFPPFLSRSGRNSPDPR